MGIHIYLLTIALCNYDRKCFINFFIQYPVVNLILIRCYHIETRIFLNIRIENVVPKNYFFTILAWKLVHNSYTFLYNNFRRARVYSNFLWNYLKIKTSNNQHFP